MKTRNVVFSILICFFLCGPAALWTATKLDLDIPTGLTAEPAKYLSGGIQEADIKANLNFDAFLNEQLQNSLEIEIGNYVPAKATALLANSSLQRQGIATSNVLFNWCCYPTYYGSYYLYLPDNNAIIQAPNQEAKSNYLSYANEFAQGLNTIANKYQNITFVVCLADWSYYSALNPALPLISHAGITTNEFSETLNSSINASNIVVAKQPAFNCISEYFDNYYSTDHHWSGYGAVNAYNTMKPFAQLKNDVLKADSNPYVDGLTMNGSTARAGLMLANEKTHEPFFNTAHLTTLPDTKALLINKDPRDALKESPESSEFDFYNIWYGASKNTEIINENVADRYSLIIGDSYADSMQWLIAQNYQHTSTYFDAHGSYSGDETLEDRILNSDCETVYFVMAVSGLQNIHNYFPNYFSVR